jgi:hypothetical protein
LSMTHTGLGPGPLFPSRRPTLDGIKTLRIAWPFLPCPWGCPARARPLSRSKRPVAVPSCLPIEAPAARGTVVFLFARRGALSSIHPTPRVFFFFFFFVSLFFLPPPLKRLVRESMGILSLPSRRPHMSIAPKGLGPCGLFVRRGAPPCPCWVNLLRGSTDLGHFCRCARQGILGSSLPQESPAKSG